MQQQGLLESKRRSNMEIMLGVISAMATGYGVFFLWLFLTIKSAGYLPLLGAFVMFEFAFIFMLDDIKKFTKVVLWR